MRIPFFELDGKRYYEANVWEDGNILLLNDYFSTKKEAVDMVKLRKRTYKGNKKLDCYVVYFDGNGRAIETFNV